MIITQLAGGLGNQMFQYAVARSTQRSVDEKIILDTHLMTDLETDIEKIVQRPYSLNIFKNLKAERISYDFYHVLFGSGSYNRLRRKLLLYNTRYVTQQGMLPMLIEKTSKKNIYLQGNFQSESYFKQIRNELLQEFLFPELDMHNESIKERILNTNNTVLIHIRRGDYLSSLNKSMFSSVNINYYRNALYSLFSKLSVSHLNTFIFTDDIDWVKTNFNFDKLSPTIVEANTGKDSWKDMLLMTYCQHHIIANSSFSWWGAWLSQRKGINMAPKFWYIPNSIAFDINNIIPNTWNIIDYDLN